MSTTSFYLLPNFPVFSKEDHGLLQRLRKPYPRPSSGSKSGIKLRVSRFFVRCSIRKNIPNSKMDHVDCIGNGNGNGNDDDSVAYDSEHLLLSSPQGKKSPASFEISAVAEETNKGLVSKVIEWAILVSPFFFWGTSMVAMKEVIPKMGPFFVSAFRLIPAGAILIGFAEARGRQQPVGFLAWISILLFGIVDGACFQGFLVEGLQRTAAGLGSVIIDSQPLTVSVLAALLFGESISTVGAVGLSLGVIGLLLLEIPAISLEEKDFTIWGSGEWWMLLAAQSMAIGTVMVRWVSKYSDPIMATGWHMILGGLPLLVISIFSRDPPITGNISDLTFGDIMALLYTSIFGSAISYGVFFYNATRGSLTKLSSLTFLTPVFASIFGFLYLGETFSPPQLGGALVTVLGIYLVNYQDNVEEDGSDDV